MRDKRNDVANALAAIDKHYAEHRLTRAATYCPDGYKHVWPLSTTTNIYCERCGYYPPVVVSNADDARQSA